MTKKGKGKGYRTPVRFDCGHLRLFGACGHPRLDERVWCPDCLRVVSVVAVGPQAYQRGISMRYTY